MNENNIVSQPKETKIQSLVSKFKEKFGPKLQLLDSKVSVLIPDNKMRKILYITLSAFFGIITLITILGILLMPLRRTNQGDGNLTKLNKPSTLNSTPVPEVPLTEIGTKLLNLESEINEMRFPESILNIPVIESGIKL